MSGDAVGINQGPTSERRFFGTYRARVVDNNDPRKMKRVRLEIPEVLGKGVISTWAFPKIPILGGKSDTGLISVAPIDSRVLVEFLGGGDINQPMWTGYWAASPGDDAELPKLGRDIPDETTRSPKGDDQAVSGSGLTFDEPQSPFAGTYPNNRVLKSTSGHVMEVDDTPGAERLHQFHRSGSYSEVRRDGSKVEKVKKSHRITIGDDVEHVNGSQHSIVEGNREEDNQSCSNWPKHKSSNNPQHLNQKSK